MRIGHRVLFAGWIDRGVDQLRINLPVLYDAINGLRAAGSAEGSQPARRARIGVGSMALGKFVPILHFGRFMASNHDTLCGLPRDPSRRVWVALGALILCLLALFGRGCQPDMVLFSNDAPLGLISAQADKRFTGFFGYWQDLNWIGTEQPTATPNISIGLFLITGPVLYAKLYAPLSLLILGMSAWLCFRQLRLHPLACLLGALAAALNTNTLSNAAWGLPSRALTLAAAFLAVAALANLRRGQVWIRTALAGFAVGLGVSEGYDVGAIFSLYIAAFALFITLIQPSDRGEPAGRKTAAGAGRVALIAACAAFFAAQTLSTLIGTQISGISGMEQDAATKQRNWDQRTQWSLPKVEALRVVIPGLFGYRMTSADDELYPASYWGSVGQQPGWEEHRQGLPRHSGSGEFAGVLVVLLALGAVASSFRREGCPYDSVDRKVVWFWAGAAALSLLFAFGRHAPFYQFIYMLPYFSTIRNPIKFMHPFHLCLLILFAYGASAILRSHVRADSFSRRRLAEHLREWWARASRFDKRWTFGLGGVLGLAFLCWITYLTSRQDLARHLVSVGFPAELAADMARFSVAEATWFLVFLAASSAAVLLTLSGWFSGARAKWAGVVLGGVLVVDLLRASVPWIVYYDYKEAYQSNPVLQTLSQSNDFHRVTARLSPMPISGLSLLNTEGQQIFLMVYQRWLEHLFQFYNIESLDITQMPRQPELDQAFISTFTPVNQEGRVDPAKFYLAGRLWQLTSTRYVLGQTGFLDFLNQQVDPETGRFSVRTAFDFRLKDAAAASGGVSTEDLAVVPSPDGRFALFEFDGVLPRTRLFSSWEASPNDAETLNRLASREFDPLKTALVSGALASAPSVESGDAPAGQARIAEYDPKRIEIEAKVERPAILVLNDRWDPDWRVAVDGEPRPLLRCNYIMRGVALEPGTHRVTFEYRPSVVGFYVSVLAVISALALCGFVAARGRGRSSASEA